MRVEVEIGKELFVLADGVRIAKRGRPGTPQAREWVSLKPGWQVRDMEDGDLEVEAPPLATANDNAGARAWAALFPEGRWIFYEGDKPAAFVQEMKNKFGFDPSKNNDSWNKRDGYGFHCPAEHLDAIYCQYEMGS